MTSLYKKNALMIHEPPSYKRLQLDDKNFFDNFFAHCPHENAVYSFGALYIYMPIYDFEWRAHDKKNLILRYRPNSDGNLHFLQPLGDFTPRLKASLLAEISQYSYLAKITDVSADFIETYPDFAKNFDVTHDDALDDYIYRTEDLATLSGKKYAKKRNLISQARKLYSWSVEAITAQNVADCLPVLDNLDVEEGESLENEKAVILQAVKNFSVLGLQGILLRSESRVVAFSIYQMHTKDTVAINFEKAVKGFKGLYQVINQETAKVIAQQGIAHINREVDLGIEGLRQAKRSYFPEKMFYSYQMTYKGKMQCCQS
jgi:hypothetical protein